jgi:AcrR family transcriptional regulator
MNKKKSKNLHPRGRPRSDASRKAIIQATISLMEVNGYEKLNLVDVAREAGVGRQTIYRWWRSKAELVIEAVLDEAEKHIAVPDTGSIDQDLRELISASFQRLRTTSTGIIVAGLLMAGRKDAATLKIFREQFIDARRCIIREILQKHIQRRAIKADINIEIIIDLIFGAMWYRLLVEHAPLDDKFADELVDHVLLLLLK